MTQIKFSYPNALNFRGYLKMLQKLLDEVTFNVNVISNTIKVQQMDPSRVAMVTSELNKALLGDFEMKEAGVFIVNINSIIKAMQGVTKHTSLTWEVTDRLMMTLLDESLRIRTFPLIEEIEEKIPQPKVDYDSWVIVRSKTFNRDLKDIRGTIDQITLKFIEDIQSLYIHGVEDIIVENWYSEKHNAYVAAKILSNEKAIFSADYLGELTQSSISNTLKVEVKTDMPVRLTHKTTLGDVTYWLAPRIETI